MGYTEIGTRNQFYGKKLGYYFLMDFSNGKKAPLFPQRNNIAKWNDFRDGLNGGCSIFSTATPACYLLDDYSEEFIASLLREHGGNFDGAIGIFNGEKILEDSKGTFVIKSTLSTKVDKNGNEVPHQIGYGDGADSCSKDEVIADWEETLENGGIVILNVSAYNGQNAELIEENTNIESKDGHMIAFMGLTPDKKVIFADSMDFTLDNGFAYMKMLRDTPGHKKNANGEPMTLEDYYDLYGGSAPTIKGNDAKYYLTVEDAEKIYLTYFD